MWRIVPNSETVQGAWNAATARAQPGEYIGQYDELGPLRLAFAAGDQPPEWAAGKLWDTLDAWGMHAHGWQTPSVSDIQRFISNAEVAHLAQHLQRHAPHQRITDAGHVAQDAGHMPTEGEFWRLLRIAHDMLFPDRNSYLYPAKAVMLATGAAVAPDTHVVAALTHMDIPGLGHAAQLQPLYGEWNSPNPPQTAPFRKLYALSIMAAEFHRQAVAGGAHLHADPGRALDALLWYLDPGIHGEHSANDVLVVLRNQSKWYAP